MSVPDNARRILARIARREAGVGIVGLGYVGLPMALAFCDSGFHVTGVDVDARKVDDVESGRSYIRHLGVERVRAARASGRLRASTDFDVLAAVDAVLIAVPTPLTRHREPDLSHVVGTSEQIARRLRAGQLVVLESTTYPGTTDEVVRPILERAGLRCGSDFFLAFSPEREDPGNRSFAMRDIPKVVGGVDPASAEVATALYREVAAKVVPVSTARAAEAAKITENVFRAVNIALVNELKVVYDRMGIDVWEVLDAAATKPFGFMRFAPGPGLGGHCIPLDPFYLTWKAREYGLATRFIELAGEVNVAMPRWVVDKLQTALGDRGKPLRGSRVLLLGVAYKRDVDDPRESPAFALLDVLSERGVLVDYHDPLIPVLPRMRSWPRVQPRPSVPLTPESAASYDAIVIVTDHSAIDWDMVASAARLVVDTRGVYRRRRDNVVKA